MQAPPPQNETGVRRIFDEAHRLSSPIPESVSTQVDAAPISRDWFRVSSGILISALLLYLAFHSFTEVGRIQNQQVDAVPTQEIAVPIVTQDHLAVAAPTLKSQLAQELQVDQELAVKPTPEDSPPLDMPSKNSLTELLEYPVTGFPELAEDLTQTMDLPTENPQAQALPIIDPSFEGPIMPPVESIEHGSPRMAQRPVAESMSDTFQQLPVESRFDLGIETPSPTVPVLPNPAQLRGTIEKFPVTN